jgi:hypothetical protein
MNERVPDHFDHLLTAQILTAQTLVTRHPTIRVLNRYGKEAQAMSLFKGRPKNWFERLLRHRETVLRSLQVGQEKRPLVPTDASAVAPQALPQPCSVLDSPDEVTVVPGAKERYLTFVYTQRYQNLKESVQDLTRLSAQNVEEIKQVQRQSNAARSRYRRFLAIDPAEKSKDAERGFERLLSLTGVTGLVFENGSLILKAAIRYEYNGSWYDFGDWSLNLSWNEQDSASQWLTKEDRQGFRDSWLPDGRSYNYPVYRVKPGTFCFGSSDDAIKHHLRAGRLIEGIELALACMHFVNSGDRDRIPLAFYPAPDPPVPERPPVSDALAPCVYFKPDRQTVKQIYASLCENTTSQAHILMDLCLAITSYQLQLGEAREQREQIKRDLASKIRELEEFEATPPLIDDGRFDQQLDYLKNLVGVTRIDFCDEGMVIDVSIRFSKDDALYDLGDWRVYLGGRHVAGREGHHYCVENKRAGICSSWDRSQPPGNRDALISAIACNDEVCAFVSADHFPEAAALIISDLYQFYEQHAAAIPQAFRRIDPRVNQAVLTEFDIEIMAAAIRETQAVTAVTAVTAMATSADNTNR